VAKKKEKTHKLSEVGSGSPVPAAKQPAGKGEFVLKHSHTLNGNSLAAGRYKVGDCVGVLEITEGVRNNLLSRDTVATL